MSRRSHVFFVTGKRASERAGIGVGFLLLPQEGAAVFVTAFHNVGDIDEANQVQWNTDVRVGYWTGEKQIELSVGERLASSHSDDWAAYEIEAPQGAAAFTYCNLANDSKTWSSYGWPNPIQRPDGNALKGTFEGTETPLRRSGVSVVHLELSCPTLAASEPRSGRGYSGGPVIVDDTVVGMIVHRDLPSNPEAQSAPGGVLYALPIMRIVEGLQAQHPNDRRVWRPRAADMDEPGRAWPPFDEPPAPPTDAKLDIGPIDPIEALKRPARQTTPHESQAEQRLRRLARRPIHRLLPQREPTCPRDALRDELAAKLRPPVHCVALLGPPGTGKRWLAQAYARAKLADYQTIWHVRGSSRTTVSLDLAELAVELGITDHTGDPHAAHLVGLWLRMTRDWLVIVDDLGSLDDLRGLVPLHGPGDVCLSSTSIDLPQWIERVTVSALDRDDAVGLLHATTGWPAETPVEALVTELGTLPAELCWAGQLARVLDYGPDQLLRAIRAPSETRYEALVEYIQRAVTSPRLVGLLSIRAYLGPTPVPVAAFDRMARSGPSQLQAALPLSEELAQSVTKLEASGLATCSAGHLHLDAKVVGAVQRAMRSERQRLEDLSLVMAVSLTSEEEGLVRDANFELDVTFVPLLRHVISHVDCTDRRQDAYVRGLSLSAIAYEKFSNEPRLAIREYERAVELIERSRTPNLTSLAGMYMNLGVMHGRFGEHEQALTAFVQAQTAAAEPAQDSRLRRTLRYYIALTQTRLRSLEDASVSWAAWFASFDPDDEIPPFDLIATLDEYCASLPSPDEGQRQLARGAVETFASVRVHLRTDPYQRHLFTLLAARTAAHLFAIGLDDAADQMLELSRDEATTQTSRHKLDLALVTAFCLLTHGLPELAQRARVRADALLMDASIQPGERAWHLCVQALRLAEFGDHEAARRDWTLALEALELRPDAQLRTSATLGLVESLVEIGDLHAAWELGSTALEQIEDEEFSKSLFFHLLDLNQRLVKSSPGQAMTNLERLVERAVRRFGPAAPPTQVARGTTAQVMMDRGEGRRALPHAREFARVLVGEPFAPGVQARALGIVARLHFDANDLSAAVATYVEIMELLDARPPVQPDDMREAADLLGQLGADLAQRGLLEPGLRAQVRGFELHRECQFNLHDQTLGRASNIALTLELLGRLEDARSWYERAAGHARELGKPGWVETSEANVARVRGTLACGTLRGTY